MIEALFLYFVLCVVILGVPYCIFIKINLAIGRIKYRELERNFPFYSPMTHVEKKQIRSRYYWRYDPRNLFNIWHS